MKVVFARKHIAAAALSVVGAALASAAAMPHFSLEDLVTRSEIIAQAQVVGSWPAWDSSHKYIWTHYQMRVVDAVRGQAQTLVVSEPGGTLDGISQAFSGMTAWNPGENVVVFLHHVPNGYLRLTGGAQGNARVSSDGRVSLEAQGVLPATSAGTNLEQLSGLSLNEFKARLRTAAMQHPLVRSAQ